MGEYFSRNPFEWRILQTYSHCKPFCLRILHPKIPKKRKTLPTKRNYTRPLLPPNASIPQSKLFHPVIKEPSMRVLSVTLIAALASVAAAQAQTAPPALTGPANFTCSAAKKGESSLTPATLVTDTAAGWDLHSVPAIAKGVCSSATRFYVSTSRL